jgi:hypothetical protein
MRIPRADARPKSKVFQVLQMREVFGGYRNECLWCQTQFDTMRPAKYCQERCRTLAYQARQKRIGLRQGRSLKRNR